MKDANGDVLQPGDSVLCDGEPGDVVEAGGIGVYVRMERDGAVLSWAEDQVELCL